MRFQVLKRSCEKALEHAKKESANDLEFNGIWDQFADSLCDVIGYIEEIE